MRKVEIELDDNGNWVEKKVVELDEWKKDYGLKTRAEEEEDERREKWQS